MGMELRRGKEVYFWMVVVAVGVEGTTGMRVLHCHVRPLYEVLGAVSFRIDGERML